MVSRRIEEFNAIGWLVWLGFWNLFFTILFFPVAMIRHRRGQLDA
jgi:hypothetical protein